MEDKNAPNRLSSPFIQRFIVKLPSYLKDEKITVIKVEEHDLAPVVTLKIAGSDYTVIHELKENRTRVLEGDKLGVREVVDPIYAKGGNVEHKPNGMMYSLDNWY